MRDIMEVYKGLIKLKQRPNMEKNKSRFELSTKVVLFLKNPSSIVFLYIIQSYINYKFTCQNCIYVYTIIVLVV